MKPSIRSYPPPPPFAQKHITDQRSLKHSSTQPQQCSHEHPFNGSNFIKIFQTNLSKYETVQKLFKFNFVDTLDQEKFKIIAHELILAVDLPRFAELFEVYFKQLCALPTLVPENTKFDELKQIITQFGYTKLPHGKGSHIHQFNSPDTTCSYLNVQKDRGKAKPFQVRQFLRSLKEVFMQEFDSLFQESLHLYYISLEEEPCTSSSFSGTTSFNLSHSSAEEDEASSTDVKSENSDLMPCREDMDTSDQEPLEHELAPEAIEREEKNIGINTPVPDTSSEKLAVDIDTKIINLCQGHRIHKACDLLASSNLESELGDKIKKVIVSTIVISRNKNELHNFAKYFIKTFPDDIKLMVEALCNKNNFSEACDLLATARGLTSELCDKTKELIANGIAETYEKNKQIDFAQYFIRKFSDATHLLIIALCSKNNFDEAIAILPNPPKFYKVCDLLAASNLNSTNGLRIKMIIASRIAKFCVNYELTEATQYFIRKFPNDTEFLVNALYNANKIRETCNVLLSIPQLIDRQIDSTRLYQIIEAIEDKNEKTHFQKEFMRLLIQNHTKARPHNSDIETTATKEFHPHAVIVQYLISLSWNKNNHEKSLQACCSQEEFSQQRAPHNIHITKCNHAHEQIQKHYKFMKDLRTANPPKYIYHELEITILLQLINYYRYLAENTDWLLTLTLEQKNEYTKTLLDYSEQMLHVLSLAQSQSSHFLLEQTDHVNTPQEASSFSSHKLDEDTIKNILTGLVINFITAMFSLGKHEETIPFLKRVRSVNSFAKNTLPHVLMLKATIQASSATLSMVEYNAVVTNLGMALKYYSEIITHKLPRNTKVAEKTQYQLMRNAAIEQRDKIIAMLMNYGAAEISLPAWLRYAAFSVRPWITTTAARDELLAMFDPDHSIRRKI